MNVPRSALGSGRHDDRFLALGGSVLMASTNPPKVAAFTDTPPTDHAHRRQISDILPENCREQEGRYATTGAELRARAAR
ncbi:hypothetical protein GCM10010234_79200 [Streptomyces hawaiiensis]